MLTGELVEIIADEAYKSKRYEGSVQSSGDVSNGCLTVDELKAIYKQAEELGWL